MSKSVSHARKPSKPSIPSVEAIEYEFFGPVGTTLLTLGLPPLVYATAFFCNDVSGCPAPALLDPRTLTLEKLKAQTPWPESGILGLYDNKVMGWVLAYHGFSLALQLLLPGTEVEGTLLGTGGRHFYKFNAFSSAVLTLLALGVGTLMDGHDFVVWTFIWDNFIQIITANLVIASVQSVYVYIRSFSVPHAGQPNPTHRELAIRGHTGSIMHDFWIGRELSPRLAIPEFLPLIGGQIIDIKCFNEMRPGLLGYIILDLAFIAHQHKAYGYVSDSILFITGFQMLYVLDGLYMEPSILTQMDITTDGFGFMLAFGDLVWLPFVYSIQCRYLAVYPLQLGISGIAGVLAVQGIGYYIFRSANNQKDRFRKNPDDPRVAHLESMTTASGSQLLITGWWGVARHINYFGDWFMGWSYSLPTGAAGYLIHRYTNPVTGNVTTEVEQGDAKYWGMIFTYFYIVYFGVLLIHRERRDEEKCRRKYGTDWDRYCKKVRSRIIPGIY